MKKILFLCICLYPSLSLCVAAHLQGLVDLMDQDKQLTIQQIDAKKKNHLIYFWATWCSTCKGKLIKTLPKMNKRPDLAVITINIDADLKRARHYVRKYQIELPVLIDPKKELIKKLKVQNAPHWTLYQKKNSNKWELIDNQEAFDLDKINQLLDT